MATEDAVNALYRVLGGLSLLNEESFVRRSYLDFRFGTDNCRFYSQFSIAIQGD